MARGRHSLPTATRLLALVAAAVVAGGIALATGTASANSARTADGASDRSLNPVKILEAQDKGENKENAGQDREANKEHDHGSEKPKSDEDKERDKDKPNNGLDILGRDCGNSDLEEHDGFQKAPRCVSTAFGEVSAADKNPSLLITAAPQKVKVGEKFTMTVSTRNLVRDRFLGAADGGYYLERSALNSDGIQRGHFHTACRMLSSTDVAPDPAPVPAAFVATQDGGGGERPDTVTVEIPGLPAAGVAQCATWAGDGSHRIPMMERANQTPAFDAVRVIVK